MFNCHAYNFLVLGYVSVSCTYSCLAQTACQLPSQGLGLFNCVGISVAYEFSTLGYFTASYTDICITTQVDPPPPDHDNELDDEEMKVWTEGWDDQVYNQECVNPDISLGELLLLYFEWMSVHKVHTMHKRARTHSFLFIILGDGYITLISV